MDNYPINRTEEEGHTPACWTKAITVALENERDSLKDSDPNNQHGGETNFRIWLQDNGPLERAEYYLREGMTVCLCEPISMGFWDRLAHYGKEEGS